MGGLLDLAVWFGLSSLFLLDTLIFAAALGPDVLPAVRQRWLATGLAFAVATLLLTPWGSWAAVLLLATLVLQTAAHMAGLHRIERDLLPAPPEVVARVNALAARWEVPRPDRVLLDPTDRSQPSVVGLIRQSLILPGGVLALPEGEFAAIVAHELAHSAARDPLKLWVLRCCRSLLGWSPIARRLEEYIALEAEMEADRKASSWLGDREAYALALGRWTLRRVDRARSPFGAAFTGSSSHLVLRLRWLMDPAAPPPHLRLPPWAVGSGQHGRDRTAGAGPSRLLRGGAVHLIHLVMTAGYLALYLLLIRLV